MRKAFLKGFLALLLGTLSVCQVALALSIPAKPEAHVNDYAGLLSTDAKTELEQTLARFEQQTSNQIVVITFPSLEQENLEDFSNRLASQWRIGQKGKDNGVVVLVFKQDKAIRIEVGYGLEGAIPDSLAATIINNDMVPAFRADDYAKGIKAGVEALIKASQGEYSSNDVIGWDDYLWVSLFALIFFFFAGSYSGPSIALIILYFNFGLVEALGIWLGCYLIYLPCYYFVIPKRLRPKYPFAGGFKSTDSNNNSSGGSGGSFGGGSSFGGGGGSFGGGGASGRW